MQTRNTYDSFTPEQLDAAMRQARIERSEALYAGLSAIVKFFGRLGARKTSTLPAGGRPAMG